MTDAIAGRIAGVHAFQEVVIETAQIFDRLNIDGGWAAMNGPGNPRQPGVYFLFERGQQRFRDMDDPVNMRDAAVVLDVPDVKGRANSRGASSATDNEANG